MENSSRYDNYNRKKYKTNRYTENSLKNRDNLDKILYYKDSYYRLYRNTLFSFLKNSGIGADSFKKYELRFINRMRGSTRLLFRNSFKKYELSLVNNVGGSPKVTYNCWVIKK